MTSIQQSQRPRLFPTVISHVARLKVFSSRKRPRLQIKQSKINSAAARLCLDIPDRLCQARATVSKLIYYSDKTGFTVFSATMGNNTQICAVAKSVPFRLEQGRQVELTGHRHMDAKHGLQFEIEVLQVVELSTEQGIRAYLSSGVISGIGPVLAERIVDKFGDDTLSVLDADPSSLLDIKGVGSQNFKTIAASWQQKRSGAAVMAELCKLGLYMADAREVYKTYSDNALSVVKDNPYRLVDEVHGIGFIKADKLAGALGFAKDSPFRVCAGVMYVLATARSVGHCYLPAPEVQQQAAALLSVEAESVTNACGQLLAARKLICASGAYYLAEMYDTERYVEKRLKDLSLLHPVPGVLHFDDILSEDQRQAVRVAMTSGVSIITGSAGTGKTTTLKSLINCLEHNGAAYVLVAPTGKAAKRISEVTEGRPASTIHRLLLDMRRQPGDPCRVKVPVGCWVVIDEFSMVDIGLLAALLRGLPNVVQLVGIGDPFQLEPVSAGQVLHDMIESGLFPVTALKRIYRQREGSSIIDIADDIKAGRFPVIPNVTDAFLFEITGNDKISRIVVDVATKRIPEKFGIPFSEILVLSPMRKGTLGVANLNRLLQAEVRDEAAPGIGIFKENDRVMNLKNDYVRGVFNGDTGVVSRIDLESNVLFVQFESLAQEATYEINELGRLDLAYACTIHKAQGAQAEAVVLVMTASHAVLLSNSLLYTAATRARKILVIVGQKKAMGLAIYNRSQQRRYTSLFRP